MAIQDLKIDGQTFKDYWDIVNFSNSLKENGMRIKSIVLDENNKTISFNFFESIEEVVSYQDQNVYRKIEVEEVSEEDQTI
jgi:hypothetical protein